MTPETSIRYLALGDSYTIAQSVELRESWPMQLAAGLRENGVQIADPEILARTGWTTADLLRAIEAKGELGEYDLVSLLIGVNDQFQGLAIDGYRERFRELLAIAIDAAGRRPDRVIVLSIPDWSYTPYGDSAAPPETSQEIDAFNAMAFEESEAAGVHYFDITATTRPGAYDADPFADDGLHPSAKMYAIWVEMMLTEVVGILK